MLINEGRNYKYDGTLQNANFLIHHLQRLANPLVSLSTEDSVMDFLDTSEKKAWPEDYNSTLCAKGKSFDERHDLDTEILEEGF